MKIKLTDEIRQVFLTPYGKVIVEGYGSSRVVSLYERDCNTPDQEIYGRSDKSVIAIIKWWFKEVAPERKAPRPYDAKRDSVSLSTKDMGIA